MCDEVAFLLYSMVKFTRPDVVVQMGHLWGKSALMVLEAMSDGFITSDLIEEDTYRGDPRLLRLRCAADAAACRQCE